MLWNGAAVVTIVADGNGNLLAPPQLSTQGIGDDEAAREAAEAAVAAVIEAVKEQRKARRGSENDLDEAARRSVRKVFRDRLGKKPQVNVHVVRI